MTYLRDSSDAYNLVVELSGEAVTQDEYRETLDDAIAEMSESAAEMPAATFRLTRTFRTAASSPPRSRSRSRRNSP